MNTKLKESKIIGDCNEIHKILQKLDFLEERNYSPGAEFDPAIYRRMTFSQNWQSLLANNVYDFLLPDNSLILFSRSKINFSYFGCPFNCLTYKEFLQKEGFDIEDDREKSLQDAYNQYVLQSPPKTHNLLFRYDFDLKSYRQGIHPVSHLHIGIDNNIRIGISKILSPFSFFLLVLRQVYTVQWSEFLSFKEWEKKYSESKRILEKVTKEYWSPIDEYEVFLH